MEISRNRAVSFSGDFLPELSSTPLDTSMPSGDREWMKLATFLGLIPPATKNSLPLSFAKALAARAAQEPIETPVPP